MITDRLLLFCSFLSAFVLAVVYDPILTKVSLGLVSPYEKAELRKRFFAATVDALVVATAVAGYQATKSLGYALFVVAYLPLRDAVQGRSLGKFVCGLVVVNVETGLPCRWRASVARNVLLVIPGANVIAVFLETKTIIRDPQGLRLGDRFALTQVVEGFGAKDLIRELLQSLVEVMGQLDERLHRPGKVPIKSPRLQSERPATTVQDIKNRDAASSEETLVGRR
ncbi:MAG: RDD family protein [Acidobacteria bacterium]|nr:RDD family protein [Acidobacteriota bacterium]